MADLDAIAAAAAAAAATAQPPPPQQERAAPQQQQQQHDLYLTASGVFAVQMANIVNETDLDNITNTQRKSITTMHKSNELLHTFNEFSAKRYQDVYKQFDQHIKMLVAMKADLDSIFRRIRTLQAKLSRQYPKAFEEVSRA